MQLLERVHLVQFFLFEAQTLELSPTTAVIAPNGAGKSALLDALQIVLLGGDRRAIRFNAQAGGSARARSIRDYCLGTYRSGEDGRKRRTATTYVTLVFRDQDSGLPLTAGIALGASADEPEHRVHGLFLLPGVALTLDQHLEHSKGRELPRAWNDFRERAAKLCKQAGEAAEFPSTGERFLKELLLRLRASSTATPDLNAYRKAFLNALNLQRVEDVDLFVRTLVAEDRPTDIARFRALLDTFRQIREKIEQVARRIEAAETVEQQYAKVGAQAVRAASYRALGAEFRRDLLGEQIDQAESHIETARRDEADAQRQLAETRSELGHVQNELAQARLQLQGNPHYGAQAGFEELAGRDREQMLRVRRDLLRQTAHIRDRLHAAAGLDDAGLDPTQIERAAAPWNDWHARIAAQPEDAALGWEPAAAHADVRKALADAAPVVAAVTAQARRLHAALEQAQARRDALRRNRGRVQEGQSELRADVVRLLNYLREDGIEARPVCDLVRIDDPAWQPAIEAYLRSHVEALLVPAADEERAVRLVRSLQGSRAVYGVKLALSSHARVREKPDAGSVAALIDGDAEAVAYLRRQLGELRCVETEAEVVRSRQGLTRDGLVAKGGGIERRRLPSAGELRIGANDNRERLRSLHGELETAEAEVRRLEPLARRTEADQQALAQLADAAVMADAVHALVLAHREAETRYRSLRENRSAADDPDLLRLGEQVRRLQEQAGTLQSRYEALISQVALAGRAREDAVRLVEGLRAQEDLVARQAVEAFAATDVDPNRVERLRDELEEKFPTLEARIERCETRARDLDAELARLVPGAWSALAQYGRDHGLGLETLSPDDWRPASALLQGELARLRDTELVRYREEAEQAYATAVETFRSGVVSTLYDNFTRLRTQIETLNRTLLASPAFSNNERYRFHYEVAAEFRELHKFIQRAVDTGGEDTLFGSAGEVPAAFRELVEDSAGAIASPLDDYRRFFRFEVQIRQDDKVVGTLSERMRSGSGGEHRAPLYVIAGAALAAAYGKSEAQPGGMGVILLDEFGDKIDAQNARAITNYLRSLGLQLVLAAPDTAQGTLSGVLDSYIELFRDNDLLQVERIEVQAAARELLASDQFDLHPELLAAETERIARELGTG